MTRKLAILAGCIVVGIGAVLGLLQPVDYEGVDCGSTFIPDTSAAKELEEDAIRVRELGQIGDDPAREEQANLAYRSAMDLSEEAFDECPSERAAKALPIGITIAAGLTLAVGAWVLGRRST